MAEPFKNWMNPRLVETLARDLHGLCPTFPAEKFAREACGRLPELELKGRVAWIAECLRRHLPSGYPEALRLLIATLKPPLTPGPALPASQSGGGSGSTRSRGEASGESGHESKPVTSSEAATDPEAGLGISEHYYAWPIAQFVETYGLEHPELSLPALREITMRFSAEFALRPYLVRHPEATLIALRAWVNDSNHHVRRLVSEGSRPRLPWGMRLQEFVRDPSPTLPFLEALRDDPSEYVRRSVANHLNDIGKDHPVLLADIATRWLAGPVASMQRERLVRHALRSLVKAGDAAALRALGIAPARVELSRVAVSPRRVRLGERFELAFTLTNLAKRSQILVVDYVLHLVRAGGKRGSKVFKLCRTTLKGGELQRFSKDLCLKPVTVRRYYPGRHRIEIQVNGKVLGGGDFDLLP